jgi:asparagine synthase (glutamine-hydrolysing)
VRRLSIIDVQGGHQPISNEDESVWVACNGEIYNFATLRRELAARGHKFKTRTDTEVIVHLYEDRGMDFVNKLEGMFAIALWDSRERRLVLARDRMGIKPLYHTLTRDSLLFASEIKALLQWPGVPRELNREVLEEYLVFRYVAAPATVFKGILSLLPGHLLLADERGVQIERYWPVGNGAAKHSEGITEGELAEQLAGLLEEAVRSHLVSDVPLGTLSSGGLDSSILTAYAARLCGHGLNTYSVGFNEPRYNELPYAGLLSQRYQTNHHELRMTNQEFAETLPKLIWFNDAPVDQPNSVPIYLICSLAKETVTVLLTGEGADELFGGYPRYLVPRFHLRYRQLPHVLQDVGRWILGNTRRWQKLREALPLTPAEVIVQNSAFVRFGIVKALYRENADLSFPSRVSYLDEARTADGNDGLRPDEMLESLLRYEQQTHLVSLLERQDKMSMAASIESRVPYLDCHVVEFVNSLPMSCKIRGWGAKRLLKVAAGDMVPREIVQKRKWGFGVPLAGWFREQKGMGRYLDLLRTSRFGERGLFYPQMVERLIRHHLSGDANHSEVLWVLINLELWHQTFLDGAVMASTEGRHAA